MKNLLIYINPRKDFDEEGKIAVKIQIDNSLDLGWKQDDIMLVTNFPYEYNGIEAIEVSDKSFCDFHPPITKINTIVDMFDKKLVNKDELYWFHDLDAFQLCEITESELELNDKTDILFPDFGQLPKWSTGSFFFKSSARDIFNWTKDIVYKYKVDEEDALWILTGHDTPNYDEPSTLINGYTPDEIPEIRNIDERFKKINLNYNLRMTWNISSTYEMALKPIRVVHFHLSRREIDFFMYGKNKINQVLMSERLIKIFNKHGIK